jgi:small GTP-binding protein
MLKFKIVLAGSKHVGKSSLIARFCDDVFLEQSIDTIGVAFKRKVITANNFTTPVDADLVIWDFGGEEKYRILIPNYLNMAYGAVILFDLTRPETLLDVQNWWSIIKGNTDEELIPIIVGSKCDLVDERQISKKEIDDFIIENDMHCDYLETSAKTGENVELTFLTMTTRIINLRFQECIHCNEIVAKNLKICNYCGQDMADSQARATPEKIS